MHSQLDWRGREGNKEGERERGKRGGWREGGGKTVFLLVIILSSVKNPNLVGPPEDAVGGVEGTASIVPGAGVYGYTDPAIALIAVLTGAADL